MILRGSRVTAIARGSRRLWTPTVIQTALWLDANDASTVTLNGSTVSQWSDKSGKGRNATQAIAAQQPTFLTSGIGGRSSLVFDGTDDLLNVDGTWAVGTPYHIAAVVARTSNKANNSLWGGTGSTANSNLIAGWATDTTYRNAQYGNDFAVPVPAYTTPTPVIAGHDLDTAVGRAQYFDGTLAGTRANTATLVSNAGWRLGYWVGFFIGQMGEIVATPYSLSTADRQRLEGYLAWKWGLTANLPASHPYKNTPPLV